MMLVLVVVKLSTLLYSPTSIQQGCAWSLAGARDIRSVGSMSFQPPFEADARVGRPPGASGQFLRMLSINDVYVLDNYANLASAVLTHRKMGESLGCVVTSHLNGDFLSPCLQTALDGGTAMMQGLNYGKLDYACLGNHEFDMDKRQLETRLPLFKGLDEGGGGGAGCGSQVQSQVSF